MRADFPIAHPLAAARRFKLQALAALLALGAIGCSPAAPPESAVPPAATEAAPADTPPPPPEGVAVEMPTQPEGEPRPGKSSDRPVRAEAEKPAEAPVEPEAPSAQPLAPPAESAESTEMPEVFGRTLTALEQTEIPVLLPASLPNAGSQLYVSATGQPEGYSIAIGFVPDCRANACMFGTIAARQGSGDYYDVDETFERTIELADGTEAYFNPSVCGASCSAPVLEWEYGGARYRMEMKGVSPDEALGTLAGMANSAIEAGDRMGR